jgi:2-iminobutanoate/2-iminopropanoate deaminase
MKQEIKTDKAQSAPGLLSQALISNGFIFTSGFIHLTSDGKLIEGTTEDKLRQVMKNIEEVLKAANADLNDVVKVTIYVTDIEILLELNKYYVLYFSEPFPVREALCVKALPLGASIEISVVAIKK